MEYAVGKKFYNRPTIIAIVTILLLGIAAVPTTIALTRRSSKPDVQVEGEKLQEAKKYEGRTIKEWISLWDENNFRQNQEAKRALVAIGAPAVPELVSLIEEDHRHSGQAFQTLGDMGVVAEKALPMLIKIALDKNVRDPKGWTWNMPMRCIIFTGLDKMAWASERLIPVFQTIAQNRDDDTEVRKMAIWSLAKMGKAAIPILETIANCKQIEIRKTARLALADLLEKEQGLAKKDFFAKLIEQDPFDPSVPEYLRSMKGIVNYGQLHALTNKIKAIYRQRLQKQPDPELAWRLAVGCTSRRRQFTVEQGGSL